MRDMEYEGMFHDIVRGIFASLDTFIYKILSGIYNVFFNVATAEILKAELMKNLLGRVQLILGVIILFKLVISFFSGVVNPEGAGNEKTGVGSVIKRTVIVLVMMLMIVPLNIPESDLGEKGMGHWNKNMNTHGILFGTLYELQGRVLEENLIYKIINGNSKMDRSKMDGMSANLGDEFAKDVLKTFITVNVVYDGADISDKCEGVQDHRDTNCVCTRWQNDARDKADDDINIVFPVYFDPYSGIDELLSTKVINAYCDDRTDEMSYAALQENGGSYDMDKANVKFRDDTYALAYSYLWSTIVGALFCVLFLSLTIDVAVRLFKMVVLQILSPVAILSYIDPNSEKTFKKWVKTLSDTYLSLFIRVAIISLILFLINNISLTGFGLKNSSGLIGFVSKILIYFGLIMFAKEAPKFITQALGIESKDDGGLFGGLKGIISPAAGIVGGLSTGISSFRASKIAAEKNSPGSSSSFGNRAKALASGIFNGTTAAVGTTVNAANAKQHPWRSSLDKVNKANAYRMQNAEEGSTWWGQKADQLRQDFLGDSNYSRLKREEKDLKDRQQKYNSGAELLKNLDSAVQSEATKKGLRTQMKFGGRTLDTNLKDLEAVYEKGKVTGNYSLGGQTFKNGKDLQAEYKKAIANGSAENGYEFAGYRYSDIKSLNTDYFNAIKSGKAGNGYTVGSVNMTASQFGAAYADAVDYAKNTVYQGTAQFANGAKYEASTTIKNQILDVNGAMDRFSNEVDYQQYAKDNPNRAYKEGKDMVSNIKNMRDYLESSSYEYGRKIEGKQSEIATAKGNFHGNDGGQGGN